MVKPFDLTQCAHVERIPVGSTDPARMKSEEEIQAQMAKVNECLQRSPKGIIVGIEKSFGVFMMGEHQVVLQWLTYHIGFKRRPQWLTKE